MCIMSPCPCLANRTCVTDYASVHAVQFVAQISSPLLCSSTVSVSVHLHSYLLLFVCVLVCVRVSPHVLYALSACSQLIKTQCQLSCFLLACFPGVTSSRHQPPLLLILLLFQLCSTTHSSGLWLLLQPTLTLLSSPLLSSTPVHLPSLPY